MFSIAEQMGVRLVRACGSKPTSIVKILRNIPGQARKSLWIETNLPVKLVVSKTGQARKSLWIETTCQFQRGSRGCGQARKSLWIETYFCI